MRTHLSKSLQTRSQAIRTAIDKYNAARAKLPEPRPAELNAKQVLGYVFIAEFDLLRDSRCSVRDEPWARPAEREATIAYFKLKRSEEELVRVELEIRRLRSFIRDVNTHMHRLLDTLTASDPALAVQMHRRAQLQFAQNKAHLTRLASLRAMYASSGKLNTAEAAQSPWRELLVMADNTGDEADMDLHTDVNAGEESDDSADEINDEADEAIDVIQVFST